VTTEPRYRIVERLGRGGMGEVCLAHDDMLDRQVALKFLTATDTTGGLERLLGEARAAAALDHPFICSIYEVTVIDSRPCIAMEYVRGESLDRKLRGGPLAPGEALRIGEEIAEALEAAHKRRVVHRDLKPANVMLTEGGHIKVMDFGLATRLPQPETADLAATVEVVQAVGVIRGTPAYMAPEQIRGEPADRRSDIFAFGILLYELLTGTNPFLRVGVNATIAAILAEPAPALRTRVAISEIADALLRRMLAKDPEARQQSFGDVRSDLRRLAVDLSAASTRLPAVIEGAPGEPERDSIGRDAERALLLQALTDARSGRGSLVLVAGEAGVGKTHLAEDLLRTARQHGCQTLVGRCHEQDGTPPLIPYIELLEESSRLMAAGAFKEAVGASAPQLAKLLPELHRLLPDMPPALDLPPHLQQRFLFSNVRDFLARVPSVSADGELKPLAILIDDLQWADESTLQLTQYLAAQLATLPIVLIAAFRDAEMAAKPMLDQLVSQRHARSIVLRPFAEPDVLRLLAALGAANPPAGLVRKVAAHTSGNPFFIVELFRYLKDEGRLFDARGQWTRDLQLDDVDVPDTVRVVLERRLQRVSSDTQNVLKAAAIIGREFEADLLEAVAEVDGDTLMSALDEAEQARILKGPSGRRDLTWRFAHQLTCQSLAGAIPRLRRQRLHLRIADAMAGSGGAGRESRIKTSAIAHHLYCAGPRADAARTAAALIQAGDESHATYATEEAVHHYRRALEVMQDTSGNDPAKQTVQETLADLLAVLGQRSTAMEHYDALDKEYGAAGSAIDSARIARKIGTLHWHAGERGEAMAAYRRALAGLSGSAAHLEAAHLYQELGLAAFRSGDNQKAVEWAEQAVTAAERALAEAAGDAAPVRKAATAAIAHATNTIGVSLARSGRLDEARERIERSLAAARELGLLDVACRAYANLGVLYSSVEPKRAIDVSLAGLEIASRIGAASLQSYIYANLAAAYCALTDQCETEGLEAAQAAAAIDRELGQLDHLAVPLVVMAQIHQCHGELQKAQDAYREALALAEKIGEPQLILPCYDGLATICLDRGDRRQAEEYMEKGRQLCERTGIDPDTILLLPFLC